MSSQDILISALLRPDSVDSLDEADWDLLIRQGRRANLLGRLAHSLRNRGRLEQLPAAPRHHLQSALLMVERQHQAMRWEVECILAAMEGRVEPVILLKGAAYIMAGLPAAQGRTFSDVDVLVPRALLAQTESQLMIHGWQGSHHDPYQQRYYRLWSHEIPPMRHVRRGATIDVHHGILPETSRTRCNNAAFMASPLPVEGMPGLYVLKPQDMLLHSATHLFHEGELGNGLRDLFDLDSLFRHFGQASGFWASLADRAQATGLGRPLYYAVRYTRNILGTPMPESFVESVARFAPPALVQAVQDACYLRALRPHHASCWSVGADLASRALYIRSHWLRMPLPMLAGHLIHQALARPKLQKLEPGLGRDADAEA